jgi:hypothetical protein
MATEKAITGGLAAGTRAYYRTGVKRFAKWVAMWRRKGCWVRFLSPSEATLCLFMIYLSDLVVPGTIRLYLFGVRDHNLGRGYPDPLQPGICLWRVLRALSSSVVQSSNRRRPITIHTLAALYPFVDFSCHFGRLIWAVLTVGVYGLMRIGELVPGVLSFALKRKYWRARGTLAVLKVPKSKTEQKQGYKVVFTGVKNWSCAVSSVRYMLVEAPFSFAPDDYLWRLESGRPLSRNLLVVTVRDLCTRAGLDAQAYNGISLRKGGALSLSLAGVDEQVIRAMGRWKGACIDRYVESVVAVVRRAQGAASLLWTASGRSERFTAEDLWEELRS